MSGDFYRIDTTGTNSSADWDWKFLDTHLAMACGVAVDDKRIYISGGFHMHSKSFVLLSGEARDILLRQSRLVQFYRDLYTFASLLVIPTVLEIFYKYLYTFSHFWSFLQY